MHGATVAAVVAVIAWGGVALYLFVLDRRLRRAIDAAQVEDPPPPTVEVIRSDDGPT